MTFNPPIRSHLLFVNPVRCAWTNSICYQHSLAFFSIAIISHGIISTILDAAYSTDWSLTIWCGADYRYPYCPMPNHQFWLFWLNRLDEKLQLKFKATLSFNQMLEYIFICFLFSNHSVVITFLHFLQIFPSSPMLYYTWIIMFFTSQNKPDLGLWVDTLRRHLSL